LEDPYYITVSQSPERDRGIEPPSIVAVTVVVIDPMAKWLEVRIELSQTFVESLPVQLRDVLPNTAMATIPSAWTRIMYLT
jgi:VanZ family protein